MRGHAAGPFTEDARPNLRVQAVLKLTPAAPTAQVYVFASAVDPVLLRFCPHVDTALATGTNSLIIGTSADNDFYYASGVVNPETAGFGTEAKYYVTESGLIIATLGTTGIAATGTLSIGAITAANTQTVTIGSQTYTFNTVLTNTPNNVLIGADTTAMALNLTRAINGGAGAGTLYGAGTVANASASATSSTGVVTVTALVAGVAGNSIATTETLTNGSFGGATLSGGEASSTAGQLTIFIDA